MRVQQYCVWLAVLASLAAACGDGETDPAADSGAPPDIRPPPDGRRPTDEPPPGAQDRCLSGNSCGHAKLVQQPGFELLSDAGEGWLRLIEADWELAPEAEGYRCVTQTMREDVYVTSFAPLLPPGTHHTVLMVNRSGARDGVTVCGVNASGERRLQGAGAGTAVSMLPDGVAMKIAAGEQLLMNLHLFNPTANTLRGTSGMRVKTIPASQVKHEAEVRLIGPLMLDIPRGRAVQQGGCTLSRPGTVFTVGPHLHQLGVHAKITARRASGAEIVLHDMPYDFNHQLVYPIEPLQLAAGDRIQVECTYENTTDQTVHWGDSTLSEMCFAGVGIYPAGGSGGFPCSN